MNAMKLIEFFSYDYKLAGLALSLIEQREGREYVERLLAEIPAPSVQKNAGYFYSQLRELLCSEDVTTVAESSRIPEKKYGKPV